MTQPVVVGYKSGTMKAKRQSGMERFTEFARSSGMSDEEILAAAGRIRSAMRVTHSGGARATCECGECQKCKKRVAMRVYRKARRAA
jgi:7-cyano-7-deazaguanine synthase in queuosine biosynthesis